MYCLLVYIRYMYTQLPHAVLINANDKHRETITHIRLILYCYTVLLKSPSVNTILTPQGQYKPDPDLYCHNHKCPHTICTTR